MATVYVGSARHDENNTYNGGKAGDQTGTEVSTQKWYAHNKGWVCLRARDKAKRILIADAMAAACKNNHIGYDQSQRLSLYNALSKTGFSVANIRSLSQNVECDCSALVRVCILCAGLKDPGNFRTVSEKTALLNTGDFEWMSNTAYSISSDYLCKGDILVTSVSGHTVVVLTDGDKAGQEPQKVVTKGATLRTDATILSKAPATDSKVITTLDAGAEITVFGVSPSNKEWVAVKCGAIKGYIPKDSVENLE